jgi:hypothetical protein
VGVEEVDLSPAEEGDQLADGGLVVLGWENGDADAQVAEPPDRAAIGQGDGFHVEAGWVQMT